MCKGILFDFNGTMFFDSPKHKEAWDAFSVTYRGKALTDEEMDGLHGQTNKQIIRMLMGEMDEQKSKELSEAKEAFYRKCCMKDKANFHLVTGLVSLLDELKQKQIPMTICSASIKPNIDFFIASFQLERWFDPEDIVYDDGFHHDKVSMFHDGASRIHVPIEECIVIEDSLSGIEFAHQCHVAKIIAMTTPEKKEAYEKLPGVDQVIFDFTKIDLYQL